MTNNTTVQSLTHSGLNEITTTLKDVQIGKIKDDSLKTVILGSVSYWALRLTLRLLFPIFSCSSRIYIQPFMP